MDRSPMTLQDKNIKLFHSEEPVEDNLVQPSSKNPAAEQMFKPNSDTFHNQLCNGEFVESNRLLYRQKFVIRSYEVGADKATSITTMLSFFQEVSVCHVHLMGITGDGLGATKAMNHLGLIWVVAKTHVEVEEFPKWPSMIEIDSWIARAGKNGVRRDWIVRHCETNDVLVRATSTYCMMDATTRRVCKMPDAAQAELSPFFWDGRCVFKQTERDSLLSNRIIKLDHQSAQYVSPPLQSCRADLDVNQHVSNLKYISWTLQSVPEEHLETHNLTSITLEYRRECQSNTIVESLTSSKTMPVQEDDQDVAALAPAERCWTSFAKPGHNCCQFTHFLQTQGSSKQQEIARARTTWQPKSTVVEEA